MSHISSNDLTTSQQYKPTPSMVLWVATSFEIMTESVTEIAEACNISRQSWYTWIKDENFIAWHRGEWSKLLQATSWKLDVIGFSKAKKDFRYWEAMQKRVGNICRENESQDSQIVVKFVEGPKERMFSDNP